jgi:hypothetical protein
MAQIAGVKTTKDSQGRLETITINAKEHPQAIEMLKGIGLVEKSDLRKEVEANPENFMTVEEARKSSLEHLRSVWPK